MANADDSIENSSFLMDDSLEYLDLLKKKQQKICYVSSFIKTILAGWVNAVTYEICILTKFMYVNYFDLLL